MRFLNPSAPTFSADTVAAVARSGFGLNGTLRPLYSERDQNFRLTEPDGQAWVVKVANAEEPEAVLDAQLRAMIHVAATAPDLPVPRVRPAADGALWARLTDDAGRSHPVYALTFLPGEIAANRSLSTADHHRIGVAVARLGQALSGFFHPAAGNPGLLWDIRNVGLMRPGARHLGPLQARAEALIDDFAARVLPRLPALRAQVIHGDIHDHNLILGEANAITGLIDFGDMFHGPVIFDLADALADFLTDPARIEPVWDALAGGFASVTPVTADELDLLYDLACMRLLVSVLVNAIRTAESPGQPNYLAEAGFGGLAAFEAVLAMGRDRAMGILARATGHLVPRNPQPVARLIERRKKVMGSDLYVFYDPPLHIVRGEGVRLFDADGRAYLDCYNNVPILGHCHPRVVQAITAQSRILNTNTRYLGEQVLDYAERLGALTDGELTACAFVNSGSEANDIAWRMARAWTGAQGFITQEFAYHGITEAIDAVSPSASRTGQLAPHVRTILAPDGYRGRYRHGTPDIGERYAEDADHAIRSLAAAGMRPAAVIVDSAFMTNGILEPCPGYVAGVFARVRAAGGVCIADEVQAGFGRMGRHFWGYRHHGVLPDIVTIGKPAGNGHPIGVVLTRPEILDHFVTTTAFFSTFGGNNVSCAAGLAVLDAIRDGNLVENAGTTGAYLKAGLLRLMDRHPVIGDVRGTGLAFGVELVRDRDTREPAPQALQRLLNLMRDEGLLAGGEGVHGNILKMRPPIVFGRAEADIALAALDRALARL